MTPLGPTYSVVNVPVKSWKIKINLSDKAWEQEVIICGCRGVEKGSERHAVLLKTFGPKYSEKKVLSVEAKHLRAMAEHEAAKQLFMQSQTYEGIKFEYTFDENANPFALNGGWLIATQHINAHQKLVMNPSGVAKPPTYVEPSYVNAPYGGLAAAVAKAEPLPIPTTKLLDLEYKLQPPDYEKILGYAEADVEATLKVAEKQSQDLLMENLDALKKIAASMGVPMHLLGSGGSVTASEVKAKIAEAHAVFGKQAGADSTFSTAKPLTTEELLDTAKKVKAQQGKVAAFGMLYGQPGLKFASNVHDEYVFEGPIDAFKAPHKLVDYTDPLKAPSPDHHAKLAEVYDSLKQLAKKYETPVIAGAPKVAPDGSLLVDVKFKPMKPIDFVNFSLIETPAPVNSPPLKVTTEPGETIVIDSFVGMVKSPLKKD